MRAHTGVEGYLRRHIAALARALAASRHFLRGTKARLFPFMSLPSGRGRDAGCSFASIQANLEKRKTDEGAERAGAGITCYDLPLSCGVPNDV